MSLITNTTKDKFNSNMFIITQESLRPVTWYVVNYLLQQEIGYTFTVSDIGDAINIEERNRALGKTRIDDLGAVSGWLTKAFTLGIVTRRKHGYGYKYTLKSKDLPKTSNSNYDSYHGSKPKRAVNEKRHLGESPPDFTKLPVLNLDDFKPTATETTIDDLVPDNGPTETTIVPHNGPTETTIDDLVPHNGPTETTIDDLVLNSAIDLAYKVRALVLRTVSTDDLIQELSRRQKEFLDQKITY